MDTRPAPSAGTASAPRREPVMIAEKRTIHAPAAPDPDYHDEDEEQFIEDDDFVAVEPYIAPRPAQSRPQPAAPAHGQVHVEPVISGISPRVAAPAPRPAPGVRQLREAQGSLLEAEGFELPALDLLAEARHKGPSDEHRPEKLEEMARQLEGVLEDFGVKGDIINVRPGPVVTLFELEPAPGIKSSRVISLADDIARSMSAISARVAVVPGRNAIGIELPNQNRETVYLREMLASADFEKSKSKLPICLGKTIGGEPIIVDLARMPHLLIAGTTGSGKSVGINTMILSLLYHMTPAECRLIMIDPKMLELSIYDGIPHLLTPVVTDPSKAVVALKWAVREMEDRYRKMSKIGVRNIDGFNQRVTESKKKGEVITRTVQTGFDRETGEAIFESEEFDLEPLPFIVVIVDEMADLMMVAGKDIEGAIQRLAQMARAAGIHMVTATQRPSVDVITGTIKANFPTRVSFQVTSKIDSRTILGEQGAEQLLGNGDMLYMAGGGRIKRLHGPFVSDSEVEAVVNHLKSQGAPDYLDAITAEEDEDPAEMVGDDYGGSGDELYDKAVNIVLQDKKVSTSYIQRRLAIGYNKAATLIERMEQEGVISQANHAGKREILVGGEQY
jgi:S-DNA-T family DNA segregation ATPase FtsK/SpoIIIE